MFLRGRSKRWHVERYILLNLIQRVVQLRLVPINRISKYFFRKHLFNSFELEEVFVKKRKKVIVERIYLYMHLDMFDTISVFL